MSETEPTPPVVHTDADGERLDGKFVVLTTSEGPEKVPYGHVVRGGGEQGTVDEGAREELKNHRQFFQDLNDRMDKFAEVLARTSGELVETVEGDSQSTPAKPAPKRTSRA